MKNYSFVFVIAKLKMFPPFSKKNPAVMECGSGTECSGPEPESIVLSDRSETASLRSGSDSGSYYYGRYHSRCRHAESNAIVFH